MTSLKFAINIANSSVVFFFQNGHDYEQGNTTTPLPKPTKNILNSFPTLPSQSLSPLLFEM